MLDRSAQIEALSAKSQAPDEEERVTMVLLQNLAQVAVGALVAAVVCLWGRAALQKWYDRGRLSRDDDDHLS